MKLNNFDIAVNWIVFVLGPNTGSRGLTKNVGVRRIKSGKGSQTDEI